MPKIIYLNEARQISLSSDYEHIMMLNPGRNVVPDHIYEAVSKGVKGDKENQFQKAVDEERIVVQGDKLDITALNSQKALKVIDLETTVDGVQELLTQETQATKPRQNVMDAAAAKIEAITEALKEKDKAAKEKQRKGGEGGGDNA